MSLHLHCSSCPLARELRSEDSFNESASAPTFRDFCSAGSTKYWSQPQTGTSPPPIYSGSSSLRNLGCNLLQNRLGTCRSKLLWPEQDFRLAQGSEGGGRPLPSFKSSFLQHDNLTGSPLPLHHCRSTPRHLRISK